MTVIMETENAIADGRSVTTTDADADAWMPITTYLGTKWVPTVILKRQTSCYNCPTRVECAVDVQAGDFAWCEDVSPADYQLTNPEPIHPHSYRIGPPPRVRT